VILNNSLINYSYKKIAKPILFKQDPEWAHDKTLSLAKLTSNIPPARWVIQQSMSYSSDNLKQTIDGLTFKNPIGLAAGWDKDAVAVKLMEPLGFGFAEVGSITKESYDGNDYPRLTRLPKSRSIVVNYGLKNEGVIEISKRLKDIRLGIPMGTNIARTNSPNCKDDSISIEDYCYSFEKLKNIGDYFTINISCPNTFGGQPFHEPTKLKNLLKAITEIKTKKPIYLKISPDISNKNIQDIVNLAYKYNINGFICGNLTKNRRLKNIYENNLPNQGGLSGAVVKEMSNHLIANIYSLTGNEKTIIGLGGVFNAEDAWQKIGLGANLVQLITGLIYEGPGIVGLINKKISQKVTEQGFSNISEARGFLA
jgi:dihydroorotate dehydrogenase